MNRRYLLFGQCLRSLRLSARLTQTELAKLIDVSHSYPSVLERGINRPEPPVLRRLVAVLRAHGAPADYAELAALCGYGAPPPAASVPVDELAKVPILRRLAGLPLRVLEGMDAFASRVSEEAYDPETGRALPPEPEPRPRFPDAPEPLSD